MLSNAPMFRKNPRNKPPTLHFVHTPFVFIDVTALNSHMDSDAKVQSASRPLVCDSQIDSKNHTKTVDYNAFVNIKNHSPI